MRNSLIHLVRCLLPILILAGCQSEPESTVKQPERAKQESGQPAPQPETISLTGSAAQRYWIRHFTEAINTTTERFAHYDTTGAIQTADSLRLVCESVLDTLPQDDTQSQFLMVVVADLYGKLRLWKGLQGDQQGVTELTNDYADLVRRMHDKATAEASPDAP